MTTACSGANRQSAVNHHQFPLEVADLRVLADKCFRALIVANVNNVVALDADRFRPRLVLVDRINFAIDGDRIGGFRTVGRG